MIFHWRSKRYRGGSGWFQSGLVVMSVGMSVQIDIVPATVTGMCIVPAENRIVRVRAENRIVSVDAENRIVRVRRPPRG